MSYILRDAFAKKVETALSNRSTERALFKHIIQYRDNHIAILSSPYIHNMMPFTKADFEIVFNTVQTSEKEVQAILDTVKLETRYYDSFIPFKLLLLLIIRYYHMKNDKRFRDVAVQYYSYGLYFSLHSKFFPDFKPKLEVMKYTINNITNKFTLKKEGSLEKALYSAINVGLDTYVNDLTDASDASLVSLTNALKSRARNMVQKIAEAYYKNIEDKNIMFSQTEKGEDDQTIERVSTMGNVESLADQYTLEFFSRPPSMKVVNLCSRMCSVSATELRTAINLLINGNNITEVKNFYASIFYLYFSNNSKNTVKNVKSTKFIAEVEAIYKKGNSIDKNIINIKALTHKWLSAGTATYKTTNREATKNNFRKAIYMYFVFMVASNKE